MDQSSTNLYEDYNRKARTLSFGLIIRMPQENKPLCSQITLFVNSREFISKDTIDNILLPMLDNIPKDDNKENWVRGSIIYNMIFEGPLIEHKDMILNLLFEFERELYDIVMYFNEIYGLYSVKTGGMDD
jgi:hypothetical protein